jgi:hypothetical protein
MTRQDSSSRVYMSLQDQGYLLVAEVRSILRFFWLVSEPSVDWVRFVGNPLEGVSSTTDEVIGLPGLPADAVPAGMPWIPAFSSARVVNGDAAREGAPVEVIDISRSMRAGYATGNELEGAGEGGNEKVPE